MTANMAAYTIGHMITLPALLLLTWRWCALWVGETRGLIGVLLMCAYLPLMFSATYGIALYTVVEAVILAGWQLLIYRRPATLPPLVLLVILGTLNRETAILLPMLYGVVYPRRWRSASVLFGVWLVVFVSVRLVVGPGEPFASLSDLWSWNTGQYAGLSVLHVGLMLPVALVVLWGVRCSPPALTRTLVVVLIYLGMVSVWGLWNEVRLFLPVIVIALPIGINGFTLSEVSNRA